MRAKTIKYFIEEGLHGFKKNGLMTVASVFIVVASLLILGIYLIFSLNINYIGQQVEAQYEIRAFIEVGTDSARITEISNEIKTFQNVNDVTLISSQQALDEYREELGENAHILDGLEGDNPLRDSLKITMTDLNYTDIIAHKVTEIKDVAWVKNNKDIMSTLMDLTSTIRHGSFILMILLSLVAIFIISNAIRMTVFSRRREIGISKFLGATDWFIRWPFIIEGIIMGVAGSVIAIILIIPCYNYIYSSLSSLAREAFELYTTTQIIKSVSLWFVCIGAMLGAFGSGISLGRYLKV